MSIRKKILLFVVLIAVIAVAWYLISPLFIDIEVDESFPEIISSEEDSVENIVQKAPIVPKEDGETKTPVSPGSEEIQIPTFPIQLTNGEFEDVDFVHKGTGSATIYQLEDNSLVLRFENFEVTNGPGLKVLLSNNPRPRSQSEVKDAGYVDLGNLKGNKGNQNYIIPSEIILSNFSSVVIYCYPFKVVFSTATLQ